MSIPTIKRINLSGYRKILTSKSCRSEKFAPTVTTQQSTYMLRDSWKIENGRKIEENGRNCKHRNTLL